MLPPFPSPFCGSLSFMAHRGTATAQPPLKPFIKIKIRGWIMDFLIAAKHIFVTYIQGHMYIAVAIVMVLCLLLFRKPKIFFTIFFIALFLAGVLYLISTLSTTGASQKQKLIKQEEQLYRDFHWLFGVYYSVLVKSKILL